MKRDLRGAARSRAVRVRPIRDALAEARDLGIPFEMKGGEVIFKPKGAPAIRQNNRKKDANIGVARMLDGARKGKT